MTTRTALLLCSTLIAVTVATPALGQDWAGRGRAQGKVVDESGEPVEGAVVTLRQPASPDEGPEPVTSNAKGRWSVLGLAGGPWRVLIDADGYLPSEGSIAVNPFQAAPPIEITLQRNPTDAVNKGEALLEAGDYAGARAEYQKAMADMEPIAAARVRSRVGDTYLAEGDYAAARAEYEKAIPMIPPEEQTHLLLQIGNSYQQEGNFDAARQAYEKVLPKLQPEGQAQILLAIARGHDQAGQRNEAIAALEKAVELDPQNSDLIQLLADLLSRAGREEEARAYLDQLPEDTALPSDMVLNLGIRLYNEGDAAKALTYFDRAVRENPEESEPLYYRGLAYLATQANDEATADFKKYLEMEPDGIRADEVKEFLSFLEPGG